MRYSFDDARASSVRTTQFYSMLGSRGMYHDGWKAVTNHPTISGWGNFGKDVWELYHTDVDRSELNNLALEFPEKVQEMINLWYSEGSANQAFPLDDRSAVEILTTPRPVPVKPRNRYVYYPNTADVPENAAVNIRNRWYIVAAEIDVTDPDARGVIFAHGSRFGGRGTPSELRRPEINAGILPLFVGGSMTTRKKRRAELVLVTRPGWQGYRRAHPGPVDETETMAMILHQLSLQRGGERDNKCKPLAANPIPRTRLTRSRMPVRPGSFGSRRDGCGRVRSGGAQ
jgi:hypothetical protein